MVTELDKGDRPPGRHRDVPAPAIREDAVIDDQDVVTTMWLAPPLTTATTTLEHLTAAEPSADPAPVVLSGSVATSMAPSVATSIPAPAPVSALEAAWAAVRRCQRAEDLTGLILAQMALELVDGAARRNA